MLPNAHHAVIDPSKVRDYLLSPTHPVGRFKAVVFNSLGYSATDWRVLADDLVALAKDMPATAGKLGNYGQKYEVSGTLTGPNGRSGRFVTVWMLSPSDAAPRFITATPG